MTAACQKCGAVVGHHTASRSKAHGRPVRCFRCARADRGCRQPLRTAPETETVAFINWTRRLLGLGPLSHAETRRVPRGDLVVINALRALIGKGPISPGHACSKSSHVAPH